MSSSDRLYRFLFDEADVRGELVQLDEVYRTVVERAGHPPVLGRLIGEALAAASLLVATLKFHGGLTLQIQASGPLKLLVVQIGSDGSMRAMARSEGDLPEAGLDRQAPHGSLAITIDADDSEDRYQGIVDLAPGSLAAALQKYFLDSEQLDTAVWLSADDHIAAGMLLQRLPAVNTDDDDAWGRARHLAATVTPEELRRVAPTELIRRLFFEETIRLFDPFPLRFRCRCSRERVADLVRSLGEAEARDILAEQGQVEIHCEFCGNGYRFDPVDVDALLTAPADRQPPSPDSH